MIKATVTGLNDGYFAEIQGHAGYAPKGEDIVCAGVSAIVSAVISRLDDMALSGEIRYRERCVSDGYVFIDFTAADNPFSIDRAETLMNLLYHGIDEISDEYPGYVELKC